MTPIALLGAMALSLILIGLTIIVCYFSNEVINMYDEYYKMLELREHEMPILNDHVFNNSEQESNT